MASNLLANAAYYASRLPVDPAERERLILEHLPHVRWVAMRIHEKIGGAVHWTIWSPLASLGSSTR